jgi:L-2-hydroxyglutarate oxidase LhgO
MADTELTIVGAGVVGLALAARLAPRHPGLILVERRARHGTETSSRNSEVIHAGLYYEPGSLKARLCLEGQRRMYSFCEARRVPHRRLTKLIVAVKPDEEPILAALQANARACGVELGLLSGVEARALEPEVPAVAALLSPSTGILSADVLMDVLLHDALVAGATFSPASEVVGLARRTSDWEVTVRTAEGLESFTSESVVNAAGLGSDDVAALAGIDVDAAGYRLHYCKGHYFAAPRLTGQVSRLVYPVPGQASLGVHVVLDLAGRVRLGPDAHYLSERELDYGVEVSLRSEFAGSARKLLPRLTDEDLVPDLAGIRPKLQPPGGAPRDFVIADEAGRGLPGLINLIGIESPGLTAALAIAEHVAGLLGVA